MPAECWCENAYLLLRIAHPSAANGIELTIAPSDHAFCSNLSSDEMLFYGWAEMAAVAADQAPKDEYKRCKDVARSDETGAMPNALAVLGTSENNRRHQ